MKKPPLAITIRSFNQNGEAMKILNDKFQIVYINSSGARLSENDLILALKNAEYVIAGTELFSKRVLEESTNLKIISRVGVGIDNIHIPTAEKQQVCILNTPEAPGLAVAEHTLALLFAVLKRIPQYNQQMRAGNFVVDPGYMLHGKKIGVIGLGRIGYRVASMLAALGCKIYYYDPFIQYRPPSKWIPQSSIDTLVRCVDIISLHSTPQKDGSAIMDNRFFRQCKKGIIVLNTARGALIDENAFIAALESGVVSAAGLDVFASEPYNGELLKYSQVIVTPHVASNTIESRQQMEIEAVKNILKTIRI
jgi:D-3-phosphoglycerate dehydrogenase